MIKLVLPGLFAASLAAAAPAAKKAGVPPEARRHFVKAVTFQKEAKVPADFDLAIAEYREALKLKPDWQEAQYNLAVALESAGKFDEAEAELKKYIALKPKDKEKAEDKLAAMEAKKVLAQRRAGEEAVKKRQEDTAAFVRKLAADYQNAVYDVKLCSYLPESAALNLGKYPAGCNMAELDGSNWRSWSYGSYYLWVVEEDATVRFGSYADKSNYSVRGKITGPSLQDIRWEQRSPFAGQQDVWIPAYFDLIRGLDKFEYSYDRPVSNPSPSARYDYGIYTRR